MSKIVDNIRQIVDRPTEVDVTIIDKAPIPTSRGEDSFRQDAQSRTDNEKTYTLKQIIDNEDGPVLHDDSNTQDPYDHVAKITGMVDNEFTNLDVILKPNGVFD